MSIVTIPTTPSEFVALLKDEKRLAQIEMTFEGGFEGFMEAYNKAQAGGRATDAVEAQLTKQAEQFSNQMAELQAAVLAGAKAQRPPVGEDGDDTATVPPWTGQASGLRNAAYNKALKTAQLDKLYNIGTLALDIHKHRSGRPVSNPDAFGKVQEVTNAYSESDPSTGGFLVPEETRSTIMQLALNESVVRSRATVITMSSLTTKIPYVDETTRAGVASVFGGMVFYWVGESATITSTEAKFGNVKLEAQKLVGGARVPNELWADASAFRTWLEGNAPKGLALFEDYGFTAGTGVGQPLGFRNAGCKVQYDRAASSAVALDDLAGMYARMLPQSHSNAVWLVNQSTLPKLMALTTGSGGFPLGVVNIANGLTPTILGRPLIVTDMVPALGSADDLMYVDLSYYLIGDRQAISLDYSEHSRFMNDETELRIIERVDGRPWLQSALTPVNGSDTLSPFVGITAS